MTDDEKGIVESIKTVLPNLKWLQCWNHLFQDVRRWLRNHGAPSQDIEVYIANLRKLFHKSSESEYQKELQEVSKNGVLHLESIMYRTFTHRSCS